MIPDYGIETCLPQRVGDPSRPLDLLPVRHYARMLEHCPNKQTLCHCDCRPPEGPRCQKFVDPPLEEDGFEPPVPLGSNTSVSAGFVGWRGGRGLLRKAPVLGRDRQFESVFLQR